MPGAIFYNKKLLGQVDETDFVDQQGIGDDPLYNRFKSVEAVVKGHIAPQYQSFLSCPYYEDGDIYRNSHLKTPKSSVKKKKNAG